MSRFSIDHNKKYFSFLIIPANRDKTYSFRISRWTLRAVVVIFVTAVIFIGGSFFYTVKKGVDFVNYRHLKTSTREQSAQIENYKIKFKELKGDLESLLEKEEEIENMIGDSRKRKKKKFRRKKKSKVLKKYREAFKKGSLQEKIQALQECIEEIRASINQHYAKTIHNKARFAATPSIWPVYGRIRSGYGWRRHPILGKRFFHKGIDIPSWTGAPIKATADGIIKYAGWSGAFGNVVVIDHNFGFRTIYAHALQILVIRGSFVKKGQVIAQVGSTGLSTGAHVHYEIRRWDKAVNPRYYLDLDMFTASTRMW